MPSSGQFLGRGPSGRILNNAFKLIERIMRAGIFEQTPKGMHLIGMSSLPRETAFILLELPKWLWWCGPIIQSIYISWHKHPVFLTTTSVHISQGTILGTFVCPRLIFDYNLLYRVVFLTGTPLKITSIGKSLSIRTGTPLKITSMEKS